jgi:anti-sigma factor RsiW
MSPSFFGESRFGRSSFGRGNHLGDALSALLDGELSMRQQEAARAHLAACADCAQELSEVGQARSWIRGLPLVDPPFGFYERMLRNPAPAPVAVGGFGGLATLRRRAGLAALGAAAAAVTVLGVGSPSQQPVTPAVPRFVEAHAAGASVGADLLSKLAPAGIPVSFGR